MAKSTNRSVPAQNSKGVNRPQPVAGNTPKPAENKPSTKLSGTKVDLLAIAGILVVALLALKSSLLNQFTNWDDPGYVINQPVIKDLSGAGIREIFSTAIMGNYHPLTMLTLAIDYASDGLNAAPYHLTSLLFHLATTALVFVFVKMLAKDRVAAVITALLFGVHPMHVESVAWVAGRKDVVYGLFYMAACIMYIYYIREKSDTKKWQWYGAMVVLFLCSLLSKPVAVILPVSLLAVDYFENRLFKDGGFSLNISSLTEKIPLFLISVGFGYKSLIDQRVFGALGTQGEKFNFIERIGLGGYALVTYLWKAVVPVKLLCFYPYPLKENGSLPAFYYVYPLIAIIVLGAVVWLGRRNKALIFGLLFFLVNIALLLQFIPVGGAIIADRYSYIPYLGLFFMLAMPVAKLYNSEATRQIGRMALGGVAAYSIFLAYLSDDRCKVWYDGMSLWRDEIEVEPVRAPNGYNNLGFFYFTKFNNSVNPAERKTYYDSSFYLLNKAIQLQAKFVNPYISIGELLRANNEFERSKGYYYKALTMDSTDMAANAYLGLAIVYSITQKFDSAYFCFVSTLRLKPYNPEAHSNYGNFLDMTGHADSAIIQYGIAIQQNPDIVQPYLNRARALQRSNRCDEAFRDFEKALAIMPDMGEIYYARSRCFFDKGNKMQAIKDVEKARSLGFANMDPAYLQLLR